MVAVPAVLRAEYRGDFKVYLMFQDGTEGTVDFAECSGIAGERTFNDPQ